MKYFNLLIDNIPDLEKHILIYNKTHGYWLEFIYGYLLVFCPKMLSETLIFTHNHSPMSIQQSSKPGTNHIWDDLF